MSRLMRFEFRKAFRSLSFYIIALIGLGSIILTAVAAWIVANFLSGTLPSEATDTMPTSAFTAMKGALSGASFTVLGAIYIALFVAEDYSKETIKGVYAKGYSRNSIFWAKYLTSLVMCLIMFAVFMGGAFIINVVFFGLGTAGENFALSLIATIFIGLAYHALFFALSISVRKTAGCIAIGIITPIVISGAFLILDTVAKDLKPSPSTYWLDSRLTQLSQVDVALDTIGGSILTAVIVIVIALAISYFVNHKRDS